MMEPTEAVKITRDYLSGDPWIAPSKDKLFEALETLVYVVDSLNATTPLLPKHFIPADAETSKSVDNYIESISTPTGVNIFDILDKNKE